MAVRVFLALQTLIWLPYGIVCFFVPEFPANSAGLSATSATATTELRAMYGGLQLGIGILTGLAFARPPLRRPALILLLMAGTALGVARLVGAVIDGGFSAYTNGAIVFELATAGFAAWLLRRKESPA
ncbi:MAG: DUF4345 domain-containing protein [Myxococcota bacterium]|nr:DUF4345 domain-containing protein [Myxococcota bacterium]